MGKLEMIFVFSSSEDIISTFWTHLTHQQHFCYYSFVHMGVALSLLTTVLHGVLEVNRIYAHLYWTTGVYTTPQILLIIL
jgi:hypothetical protein